MRGNAPWRIGDRVEKFTGSYTTFGEVRAIYTTKLGERRYVVEVEPQGFQMIWGDKELRLAPLNTPRSHFDREGCDPPQWHGPTGE